MNNINTETKRSGLDRTQTAPMITEPLEETVNTATVQQHAVNQPVEPPSTDPMTEAVHIAEAAAEIHLALGGHAAEKPSADVLDAAREALRTVRVQRAPATNTDGMASRYRPMTHPEDWCHEPYCLARVEVDEHTGRAWLNYGVHRRAVRSLEIAYGLLAQVGVGVSDDFELDIDRPFVHLWLADLDDNDFHAEEIHMTAAEADRLGDFLKGSAVELRATQARLRAEAQAADGKTLARRIGEEVRAERDAKAAEATP